MASKTKAAPVFLFPDRFKCPSGHRRTVMRRSVTAGQMVKTYCPTCGSNFTGRAGKPRTPRSPLAKRRSS